MVGSLPGDLGVTKLIIKAYSSVSEGEPSGPTYTLMINPESFSRTYTVCANVDPPPGTIDSAATFQRLKASDYTLSFIIDASGVTGRTPDTGSTSPLAPLNNLGLNPLAGLDESAVENSINHLLNVVYTYDSAQHRTRKVRIALGDHIFEGVLSSITLDYTHFYPSGKVLRAKVNASFKSSLQPTEEAKIRNANSPDMTHMHRVSRGERLDQLCKKIYGDSSWYMDVAKANNLTDYRNLEQGQEIFFPPLKK